MFAQIAECDERGEEDGQRQGGGCEGDAGVEEEFAEYVDAYPFPDHVVDELPKEKHEQDEQTDTVCGQHEGQEAPQDERVQSFELNHTFFPFERSRYEHNLCG